MKHSMTRVLCQSGLLFALLCSTTRAQTETQPFDSESLATAAGWMYNEAGADPDRDCPGCVTDLTWKPTKLAGGVKAGEGGGLLHRSGNLPIGFYADTTIGELTLEIPISASGKVVLINDDFDGHVHLGFLDTTRLAEDPTALVAALGFRIAEPGGGVEPNFRWGEEFNADVDGFQYGNNDAFINGVPDSEGVDFSIDYDPNEGDGVLTLVIADEDPYPYALTPEQRAAGATFTGFGVFTGPFLATADQRKLSILLDDVTYTSIPPAVQPGDHNENGQLDAADLDLQAAQMVLNPVPPPQGYDLNSDNVVNFGDRLVWLHDLKKTWVGDSNLDGQFKSDDFVLAFQAGKYEVVGAAAKWEQGDWNGDQRFTSDDFVAAFADGGYEAGPRPGAVSAVPEPSGWFLMVLGAALPLLRRTRACRKHMAIG